MQHQDIAATANQPNSQRIKAFDIIRGLFLIIILINHIELYPSFFDFFTGRGRLLVSAAEGFFFMSGLLVGMVYKRRLALGTKFIFKKMWTRAAELYVGSVVLTLLFTALAVYLNHPSIKDGIADNIKWPHLIGQTLLLRYSFGWADFLDRFAILMFMAPFAFYLINKGRWWLVAIISIALWAAPGDQNPLDTLNWQIIFIAGMLAGFYWNEFRAKSAAMRPQLRRRLKAAVIYFSAVTFAFSYASVFFLSKLNQWLLGNPGSMPAFWQSLTLHWNSFNEHIWLYAQKWSMGPLRIVLFMLWFLTLYLIVRRYENQIIRYSRGFIELLGRNSLFVYISHAFIVFAFKLFIPPRTNIFQNFAITAAALILLFLTTIYYQKWSQQRARKRSPEPAGKSKYYSKPKMAES
jgi:peptidoglycan/LPS O-acetylase OafA/YrhL